MAYIWVLLRCMRKPTCIQTISLVGVQDQTQAMLLRVQSINHWASHTVELEYHFNEYSSFLFIHTPFAQLLNQQVCKLHLQYCTSSCCYSYLDVNFLKFIQKHVLNLAFWLVISLSIGLKLQQFIALLTET